MTTPISVLSLLAKQTADEILTAALELAAIVGLPVASWRVGDPTRTQFRALAGKLENVDTIRSDLAAASFLSTAEDDWLTLRAADVYNVTREVETFATPTLTVNNSGGGHYEIAARGLTVSSISDVTYTNQAAVTIPPSTLGIVILLEAEVGGSAGACGLGDITTIVSPPLVGVTIVSNTAASAADEQDDPGLVEQCLASLGALSPNGPADAYEYVARSTDLTGISGVTRAQASGDSADGTVTVYVATTTAALSAPNVALIQTAVDEWAQPLCTDATVISGAAQTIAVTLTGIPSGAQDAVEAGLDDLFASVDFGGYVARDAITSAARVAAVAAGFAPAAAVSATLPVADVDLAVGVFPVRGTVVLS